MGREVRRVPRGWEHPKDWRGRYQPMLDEDYETKAREWMEKAVAWQDSAYPERVEAEKDGGRYAYYWEWAGAPPDEEYCRPKWDGEPTCYQIYETVTEGTPVSPVFETKDRMIQWLMDQGHSRRAAEAFAEGGWVPSMVITGGRLITGIDVAAELRRSD